MARKEGDKAYAPELEFLEHYQQFLADDRSGARPATITDYSQALEKVLVQNNRLLEDLKLLTSVGDRLQRKVKSANMMLQQQSEEISKINDDLSTRNNELQLTLDELTRARASRRAQTQVLFVALGMFVLSELLEEFFNFQTAQAWVADVVSWSAKLVLFLLIQPMQRYFESRLVRNAMAEDKRALLDKLTQAHPAPVTKPVAHEGPSARRTRPEPVAQDAAAEAPAEFTP